MSQTHAHPAHPPKEKQSAATHEKEQTELAAADPIPAPDQGSHPRSHAAHLETEGAVHTKPEGNLRQGADPGALRQPPMVVNRIGKQNRGQ